jgi:hypothetical protein
MVRNISLSKTGELQIMSSPEKPVDLNTAKQHRTTYQIVATA